MSEEFKEVREVSPGLITYNVEKTEVTGGTFSKVYTEGRIGGMEEFLKIKSF